ncbi:MAG: hypothetical protein INR70_32850 [Parafilimonas terrae]|nr:hypothetical protein [Parafilimonas terrae]
MKSIRLTMLVEHRFVHEADEQIVPLNDIAQALARPLSSNPIPDTDMIGSVWKVPEGAEMSVPDKCAAKLIALGYAELLAEPAPAVALAAEPIPVAAPAA